MGICMGKDVPLGELESDGRFKSQFTANNDGHNIMNLNLTQGSETIMTGSLNSRTTPSGGVIRFSEPRVPVIFILGGPGSGKITHCDRSVQERHGLAHVNMTDLIQQHIVGNGLDDFNHMPATDLVQVLMMEMKMAVNASAYLISGYPRSMRDVVEYLDKLRRVDGVILLNWHVKILEKQIEFGAQLGETVLQLARMELKNYSKNVLAVADYFDQLKKLIVVDGERQPTEVYGDFLEAVDKIIKRPLGGGVVHGRDGGSTLAPNGVIKSLKVPVETNSIPHQGGTSTSSGGLFNSNHQLNSTMTNTSIAPLLNNSSPSPGGGVKFVIWVIGGPGSNKSLLSSNPRFPWKHLSIGHELRNINKYNLTSEKSSTIRANLRKGELVSNEIIMLIINLFLAKNSHAVIDGFPRNVAQINLFEEQTGLKPPCILVDCSEVELGRSLGQRGKDRGDNDTGAVKARLSTYRLVTLPTLKKLDDHKRLYIVDGDAEPSKVVSDFTHELNEVMNALENGYNNIKMRRPSTDTIRAMYQEVEDEP